MLIRSFGAVWHCATPCRHTFVLVSIFCLALGGSQCQAAIFSIAATANPFLADPANASLTDGTAPAVLDLATFPASKALSILGLGQANEGPAKALSDTADGKELISLGSMGGISGWNNLPLSSLVGIFLGDTIGPAPNPIDRSLGAEVISPQLGQVFFIGDGLTGTGIGAPQRFVIPTGATKLYLAVLDTTAWADNQGGYQVIVTRALAPIPEPATGILGLIGSLVVGWTLLRRRR